MWDQDPFRRILWDWGTFFLENVGQPAFLASPTDSVGTGRHFFPVPVWWMHSTRLSLLLSRAAENCLDHPGTWERDGRRLVEWGHLWVLRFYARASGPCCGRRRRLCGVGRSCLGELFCSRKVHWKGACGPIRSTGRRAFALRVVGQIPVQRLPRTTGQHSTRRESVSRGAKLHTQELARMTSNQAPGVAMDVILSSRCDIDALPAL